MSTPNPHPEPAAPDTIIHPQATNALEAAAIIVTERRKQFWINPRINFEAVGKGLLYMGGAYDKLWEQHSTLITQYNELIRKHNELIAQTGKL